MNITRLRRLVLFASLALLCLTLACKQQSSPGNSSTQNQPSGTRTAGTRGGSLTYRFTKAPQTFNYLEAKEEYSLTVGFFLLGSRLAEFDQDQQKHVPALAESWKWADDKRTLEVTLRDGLKFSDGHTMTADDVLFTMRAIYDERVASPLFRDSMMIGGHPVETTVVDARHLKMLFPEAVAAPEGYLSNVAVLPRHVL